MVMVITSVPVPFPFSAFIPVLFPVIVCHTDLGSVMLSCYHSTQCIHGHADDLL